VKSLRQQLVDYLDVRRQFGYALTNAGHWLGHFVDYCDEREEAVVTIELALTWSTQPAQCGPAYHAQRLSAVRGFARYLQACDPRTTVPPMHLLSYGNQRRTPYLYSSKEACSLMGAARELSPELRAVTTEAILGLLFASGLRIGEALGLERSDVDLSEGVLTIRHSKFDRSREVPLHPTCLAALRSYERRREHLMRRATSSAFFLSDTGERVSYDRFRTDFRALVVKVSIAPLPSGPVRIHDARHSFAVNVLTRWHDEGADVRALLPSLSTYMGHVNPSSTYWYLSASPQLLEHAVTGLETTYEATS
jgi:site-specific recombinase XerD